MGVSITRDTFFLPGDVPIARFGSEMVSRYFPATRNWERGLFYTSNMIAPYYIARAPHERAVVVGCSGLNTHYLLNPAEVKRMNQAGVSIAWMALPKVDNGRPMVKSYTNLAREFFTNNNSPARVLMHRDVPRYALTHSTGGQLFFGLMHEQQTNRKLCGIFSGAVHVTPYFDTAHASRDHAPKWRQKLYQKYMGMKPDVAPNERWIAGGYVKMNDWLDPTETEHHTGLDSTCGQILELQASGQKITANFNVAMASKIPSIFVIGDRDNFACPKTAIDVARKVGGEVVMAKGGFHDPLRTHPHLLDIFIERVHDCAKMREDQKAATQYISAQRLPKEELITFGDVLRHRARAALQSGTGFLNTTASFF